MKSPENIAALAAALRAHGHFTDVRGNISLPQLEFSPFQKVPKKTARVDARSGTIDNDSEFLAFLASLKSSSLAPVPADEGTTERSGESEIPRTLPIPVNDPLSVPMPTFEKVDRPSTTPLIEYLRAQKAAPPNTKSAASGSTAIFGRARPSRSERRARERIAKEKEKSKGTDTAEKTTTIEPTALLKRSSTAPRASTSHTPTLSRTGSLGVPSSSTTNEGEKEKAPEKPPRERRRPAGVAAILQRDLGLGVNPRRSRAGRERAATGPTIDTSQPSTPTTEAPSASAPTTPAAATPPAQQQSPASTRPRERPSRRERRAAKLEREESTASNASTSTITPSTPVAPMAILKKQESAPPTLPSSSGAADKKEPPTAPAAAPRRTRRGGGARGNRTEISVVPSSSSQDKKSQTPQTPTATGQSVPPTGPAAETQAGPSSGGGRGGRGRGSGRGGYRGRGRGRGRGEGGDKLITAAATAGGGGE